MTNLRPKKTPLIILGSLLVLFIAAMFLLRNFVISNHVAIEEAEKPDTIHAAIVYGPDSYKVLTSEDGNDSIAGINYYLLKGLEKELKTKVMLHPVIDREDAMEKVRTGEYDILASLPADLYLKNDYLTSGDVYLDRMVLLQKKPDGGILTVRSALDLDGDTVHVEKGSAATRRLENLQKEIGGKITVIEEPELSEEYLAMKVAAGVWKYTVVNEKIAKQMKEIYPDLDYTTPVSFTQFQVWVLPQGHDSLLNLVNDFIKKSKADSRKH